MLQAYGSPEDLWAEAVAASVYVLNRVLNKQSTNITAYEGIFKRRPNLSHLRVFGCPAYAHVPESKRKVWEPKGRRYTFVGYDSNSTNYRLFDNERRQIVIARNVSFVEKIPQEEITIEWSRETANRNDYELDYDADGKGEDPKISWSHKSARGTSRT